MKISRTTLMFLVSGIFVIAVFILGMAYSQYDEQQSRLNDEIASAQLMLKRYPAQQFSSQKEEMESRLAKAETELSIAKASLYQSTESIEATDVIFNLAEAAAVEVTKISSAGLTTEKVEGVQLSVLPISVTVQGDIINFIDYIYKWTQEYRMGRVLSVEITVVEPVEEEEMVEVEEVEEEEEEEIEVEEEIPSATINLLIYNYEGD